MRVQTAPLVHPPALRPGDTVLAVAPSSPFEPTLAWVGLGWLAQRYHVRFDRGIFSRAGYLAGTDDRRREEIRAALAAPDVRAVIAVRGGYGVSRFAHELDWSAFAASPRWIVGFSDITALHVEAQRAGVASIHAPNLTGLGRGDARARAAMIDALEAPERARRYDGLRIVAGGSAEGVLAGGNLAMLHACAAAGRLDLPAGCVLMLEDVTERPYRVDRMLATLEAGGHLARALAIVLGDFVDCHPGPDRVTVEQVLSERLGRLGIPVVAGLPVGHAVRNDPVVLGAIARVDARGAAGTLTIG